MLFRDTFLTGLGTALGALTAAEEAVRQGLFDPEDARQIGQRSASCSNVPALEMAVRAAGDALEVASRYLELPREALLDKMELHLHSSITSPGLEVWSPACHVLERLGKKPGSGLGATLGTVSNGGPAALEMACRWRAADPVAPFSLVTCADRFLEPYFPRWGTERGMVFGDGAAAAVIGASGPLQVLATASYTDPSMEGLHRGREPIRGGGEPHATPISLRNRSRDYIAAIGGPEEVTRRHTNALGEVLDRIHEDSGLKLADFVRVVLPFFGRNFIESEYLKLFDIPAERTLLEYGLSVGHLGAGDHLVGVHHLMAEGLLRPGDDVLLVGVGAGFTWTGVVLRVC